MKTEISFERKFALIKKNIMTLRLLTLLVLILTNNIVKSQEIDYSNIDRIRFGIAHEFATNYSKCYITIEKRKDSIELRYDIAVKSATIIEQECIERINNAKTKGDTLLFKMPDPEDNMIYNTTYITKEEFEEIITELKKIKIKIIDNENSNHTFRRGSHVYFNIRITEKNYEYIDITQNVFYKKRYSKYLKNALNMVCEVAKLNPQNVLHYKEKKQRLDPENSHFIMLE